MSEPNLKEFPPKWAFIILQVVIVLLAVAVGAFGYHFYLNFQGDLALVRQARDIFIANTIFEIPSEQELAHGMIRGMLNTVDDPFTYFVEPAAHEVQTDELSGEFGGIGARLERDTENCWRIYPLPDSPAIRSGLLDGDILTGVDDQPITPETDEISLLSLLRGPVGEDVSVEVKRDREILAFTIKRESYDLPSVAVNLLPEDKRIGVVQVIRIAETTVDEIERGIQKLQTQGAQALILDLRDNGGGLVEAGVDISRLFLEDGEVIQRQFRDEKVETFKVETPGPYSDIPLVIFVNGNTASSAEIVTGALKANKRAILIGYPTYGKTTIQYIFDLQDGSSVHITSGRWWNPEVAFPQQPDYLLPPDSAEAAFIQQAIDVLVAQMP